jgi:hypothetical protein
MSWEDLYSVRPEVGNFDIGEYEDGDVEIGPMMSIYTDLGGDESEWQSRATEAIDDFHDQEMDDSWSDYYDEIRDDFAKDFFKLWNDSTGGMNAAEGFDDEDNVVSPWRINEFFELNILKVVARPSQDRREINLLKAGGDDLDTLFRVWNTTYQEFHKDEAEPDVRWAKRVGMEVDSPNVKKLKVRWPEFEAKIFDKFDRAADRWSSMIKNTLRHVINPYMRTAIPGRWPQLEGFLAKTQNKAIDDFGDLYLMMKHGKLDKEREEIMDMSSNEAYSSNLANTLYDKCQWMTVWLQCLPTAETYFTERTSSMFSWWKDNMVIMSNHKEMRDEIYEWLSSTPQQTEPSDERDPTTGLDTGYRRSMGFDAPAKEMGNGARLAYFKLPNFPDFLQ